MATTFRAGIPAEFGSLDPSRFVSWVIERAGRAVGYLVLSYIDSPEEARRAYITGLYIDPEERGKGLGATALRFAGDVGRTFGVRVYAAGVTREDKRLALSGGAGR